MGALVRIWKRCSLGQGLYSDSVQKSSAAAKKAWQSRAKGSAGGSDDPEAARELREYHERRQAHASAALIHRSPTKRGRMATKAVMKLQDAGMVKSIQLHERDRLETLKTQIVKTRTIQPVVLRKVGAKQYQVEDGHHRLAAARELGITRIPVVIGEKGQRSREMLVKRALILKSKLSQAVGFADEHRVHLDDVLYELRLL